MTQAQIITRDRYYGWLCSGLWEGLVGEREFFETASQLGVGLSAIERELDEVRDLDGV